MSFETTITGWHSHIHTGKANGHKRVDVGAALHQVGGNTGSGKVGWVNGF